MVRILIIFLCLFINTAQAKTGAQAKTPELNVSLSSVNVWQRQQVILSVEVASTDEFARLETEALELSDFKIFELDFSRDDNKKTIKVGWILFPLVAGKYEIELPRIYYRPSSGRKIKLKAPLKILQVKALPTYVPPTMPIGKVTISNKLQVGKWGRLHNTKTLTNWAIKVTTNGVLPQTIPPVLRQIRETPSLEVLPETSTQKTKRSYQGLENTIHYQIPIKALESGPIRLPELSIQYFDPQDNKLKKVISKVNTHWAFNIYIQLVTAIILFLMLLFVLLKAFKWIQSYFLQKQKIKQVKDRIYQANNPIELRLALNELSQVKGWKINAPLTDLLENWQIEYGKNQKLTAAINSLQSLQFEEGSHDSFKKIKMRLLNSL